VDFQTLLIQAEIIANEIKSLDQVIQIAYNKDADSIVASCIFARCFFDMEMPCTLFALDNSLDQLSRRNTNPTIVIGMDIKLITNFTPKNKLFLFIRDREDYTDNEYIKIIDYSSFGYNDRNANLSCLAYFVCSVFAPNLEYIITMPLLSLHSQHLYSDYEGLFEIISEDALEGEVIKVTKSMSLLGSSLFSISEILEYSTNPFFPGLSCNSKSLLKTLSKTSINLEAKDGIRHINSLQEEEVKELNSLLILNQASNRSHLEEEFIFIKSKTIFKAESKVSILYNSWDFGVAVQDAINRERYNLIIKVLLGNRSKNLIDLQKMFIQERKAISLSMQIISERLEEIIELKNMRYYIGDNKVSWYNAKQTATTCLANGLVTSDLPFAIAAPYKSNIMSIGLKASKNHEIGNIKEICEDVVNQRKISTVISGGKYSAQFTIPKEELEGILLDINSKLKGE